MAETLRLQAEMANLEAFLGFALEQADALGAPPALGGKLQLVLEELLVNVFHYAYGEEAGDAELECRTEGSAGEQRRFCVVLRDWGAPFDPLAKEAPDTSAGVDERPIGGLGILLAVQMSDRIGYAREQDANVLTACFNI
jgi:anti-sigma regulatory factor (Ser/Thr protein kinase)